MSSSCYRTVYKFARIFARFRQDVVTRRHSSSSFLSTLIPRIRLSYTLSVHRSGSTTCGLGDLDPSVARFNHEQADVGIIPNQALLFTTMLIHSKCSMYNSSNHSMLMDEGGSTTVNGLTRKFMNDRF